MSLDVITAAKNVLTYIKHVGNDWFLGQPGVIWSLKPNDNINRDYIITQLPLNCTCKLQWKPLISMTLEERAIANVNINIEQMN